jgi:glycosyltransferase involved in cell wall biosynthesis
MPELFEAIYQLPEKHWMISLLKEIERLSIRMTDRALTPNLSFQQVFESRSCEVGKMGIVMNSPEETVFRADVKPAELPFVSGNTHPFRVLHHGSIVHRHGLDILVEAVAIANRTIPSIELFFCGRTNAYLEEVLARASELGIGDKVFHLGSMPQADIARVVSACDLGVIPNRLSPFTAINMPTRIFEYLAMDRPVICPSTRGIRDYFDDGNMLFFEPGNPADLAKQIVWVHENKSAAQNLVRSGQKVYQKQVWGRQREHFLDLVEELVVV